MELSKKIEEILFGIKNTKAETVHLDFAPVAEFLGESVATELAQYVNTTQEALMKKKKSSLVPESKRVVSTAFAGFNREALLNAIESKLATPAGRVKPVTASSDGGPKSST